MGSQYIAFEKTGRFSDFICDYLREEKSLRPFYGHPPNLKGFEKQIKLKKNQYSSSHRRILVEEWTRQYKGLSPDAAVVKNIEKLKNENTFTITTGHQLCLMTGPVYFIYKIVSAISLCKQLKKEYPQADFVPVYWMASEDHDFEEISSFRFQDKRIQWPGEPQGAVGELSLHSLQDVLTVFEKHLGSSKEAEQIKEWIALSYKSSSTLSEATFKLVNALFGDSGLLVLEPNTKPLKEVFQPYIEKELVSAFSNIAVLQQIEDLKAQYNTNFTPQVNPREINLFYLTPKDRFRIEKKEGVYSLHGTEQQWSEAEMLAHVQKYPERFSPNVILRPLYQEVILPNLAYIGGGGELAYWLELKQSFEKSEVAFPLLVLRNSAVLFAEKEAKKIAKLKISPEDLFLKRNSLINKKIRQISNIDLDLSFLKEQLVNQFEYLMGLTNETDPSFKGAVEAQKKKQFKGIEVLEKRLLKAQKRVLSDEVQRLVRLHDSLFPEDTLQERTVNFLTFYLILGDSFFDLLSRSFDPLRSDFVLIEY
jgi:bacillithiol biosynthesis cysteine-adding enzyme BshC